MELQEPGRDLGSIMDKDKLQKALVKKGPLTKKRLNDMLKVQIHQLAIYS